MRKAEFVVLTVGIESKPAWVGFSGSKRELATLAPLIGSLLELLSRSASRSPGKIAWGDKRFLEGGVLEADAVVVLAALASWLGTPDVARRIARGELTLHACRGGHGESIAEGSRETGDD